MRAGAADKAASGFHLLRLARERAGHDLATYVRVCRERVAALARELGVTPSEPDLRRGIEQLRARHALATSAEIDAFLRQTGLDEFDLEALLEGEQLHASLRQSLSSAAAVQRVFTVRRALFETMELASVAFDQRDAAEACLDELRRGRTRLGVSVPTTPQVLAEIPRSGYLGVVTRADLPAEVAEALFVDTAEEFIGPVAYDRQHWVFQVLLAKSAAFTQAVYEYCEDLLVEEALDLRPLAEARRA